MAAVALLHEPLPPPWNYGVVEDGRVFFINEDSRETTWLHPAYGHPVQTGHRSQPDLPRGWEREVTEEGAPYYIDHVHKRTTFSHPVTGETAAVEMPHHDPTYQQHNSQQHQQDQQHKPQHRPTYERQKSGSKKKSTKVLDRPPSATRREDSPVSMRGWLYKQDSGGLKAWKKRWFVLSDFCLFYYKGPEESKSQGSVLLPSYRINPCQREDGVNRKFAFKAEHDNMRTYYFCAETQDEMRQWMNAMSLASILQRDPRYRQEHLEPQPLGVELELNQRAPSRDASRDESFQSSHSSERPLQPPALRWTSEQHYTEDSYYQQGTQGPHPQIDREHPVGPYHQHPDQGLPPTNGHQRYPDRYEEGQPPYRDQYEDGHQPYRDQYEDGHQPYRDQYEEEENMFYQPGQLQKQKPLTDLSQFDSNMDIPRYDQQRPYSDEPDHAGHGRWAEDPYSQRGLERQNAVRAGSQGDQPGRHQQQQQQPQGYGGSSSRLGPPGGQPPQQQQGVYNGGRERNSLSGSQRNLPEGYPGRELFPPRPGSASYPAHSPVLDHLQQWKDRVQNSPRPTGHGHGPQGHGYGSQQDMQQGSWHPEKNLQNNNNPIYENLNAAPMGPGSHVSPGRPPLPATYRDQIVRELAHPHSPTTQHDMISSAERSQHRHETEPLVFQYPEVQDEHGSWRGSQHQVPESYMRAKHEAEEAARNQRNQQWDQTQNQNYPDAYWKAKQNSANKNQPDGYSGPDPKRQSSASQRSEPTYSTIAAPEMHVTRQQTAQLQQTAPSMSRTHREPEPQNASYNSPYNNTMQNNTTYNNTTTANSFDITTIKEDPTMEDQDVLATKKLEKLKDHLNGHRLRLSISAGDLVGKSHEELVLMLIQLRRSQARLGDAHGWYRRQMDVGRNVEKEYRRRRDSEYEHVPEPLEEEHQHYETLRHGSSQVQKQADISKPLINLVDNLVTMGSLYGGNNLMLASQFKQQKLGPGQYTAPKKMIEFSRRHQEAKLTKEQEEQLKQLQEDEADLEEKLQQLYQLDRELQEHSFAVTSLQEDWELLQKALEGIKNQEAQESEKRALSRLAQQRKTIEQELSKVRQQLADASKRLEETAADNARVENEVLLLRKKIMKGLDNGGLDRPAESESLRTKEQLEAELTSVQMMIDGLSKQGAKLGEVMTTLRRSMPDLTEETGPEDTYSSPADKKSSGPTYAETDLDSMETRDLGNNQRMTIFRDKSSPGSRPTSHVYPQTKTKAVREVISPPDSVNVSYSQPPFTQPMTSPRAASYSKPPPSGGGGGGGGGGYPQPLHSHSVQGSYSQPQPQFNGHVRQTSLPASLPSSPQRNHSSLTDLRKSHTYLQPHPAHHRPSSATFGHQPTRHGQPQPFVSEPNLAGRDAELSWQDPQTISYSQTVAYSQPPSIAFSEPYGQDRSTSHVYSPTFMSGEAPDYVNIGPLGEVNSETAPEVGEDGYPVMDISEAEDNMKRFYGILPRDKPRAMTVRDIKKRENERRGRERGRRSYAEEDDEEEVVITSTNASPRTWRSQSMPRISSSSVHADEEMSPTLQSSGLLKVNKPDTSLQRRGSTSSNRSNTSAEDKRRSATDRLFPPGAGPVAPRAQYDPTSVERVRRMSDIFTPKPFGFSGSQPKGYRPVSMFNLSTQPAMSGSECGDVAPDLPTSPPPPPPPPLPNFAAVATVRPVFTTAKPPSRGEPSRSVNTATVKPMSKSASVDDWSAAGGAGIRRGSKGQKAKDRDRRLTVSSSRPVSLESPSVAGFRSRHRSAAGDLITSTVKGESKDGFDFHDLTIEQAVLFVPDKVDIPERYVPDSDDEITEEEAMIRQEKSDKIRKMLAAQSLQEWRENELSESHTPYMVEDVSVQQELRAEKRRREALLDIRQALAREVSQKTRQVAEMHRKATSEMELRHVGTRPADGPSGAASFMSLYETPTYQRRNLVS